jgi:hypothetical protein
MISSNATLADAPRLRVSPGPCLSARPLSPSLKLSRIGVSRRQVDAVRRSVAATGFKGVERSGSSRRIPRWPETRAYLLKLIGR